MVVHPAEAERGLRRAGDADHRRDPVHHRSADDGGQRWCRSFARPTMPSTNIARLEEALDRIQSAAGLSADNGPVVRSAAVQHDQLRRRRRSAIGTAADSALFTVGPIDFTIHARRNRLARRRQRQRQVDVAQAADRLYYPDAGTIYSTAWTSGHGRLPTLSRAVLRDLLRLPSVRPALRHSTASTIARSHELLELMQLQRKTRLAGRPVPRTRSCRRDSEAAGADREPARRQADLRVRRMGGRSGSVVPAFLLRNAAAGAEGAAARRSSRPRTTIAISIWEIGS